MIFTQTKDPKSIPISIQLPVDGSSNRLSKTTHQRRLELIEEKRFIKKTSFESRFKMKDLKEALKKHYHSKCAYCEQYSERWDVEHYRPKSIYYWLAYSWDNLLYACPTCNQNYKNDAFEIQSQVRGSFLLEDLPSIHFLSQKYNQEEQPYLLHPEIDNPELVLEFDQNGQISSQDKRGRCTIVTCGLDRPSLNDRRKQLVIDDFIKRLNNLIVFHHKSADFKRIIERLINEFAENSMDSEKEFLAFRRYVLKNLLTDIIIKRLPISQDFPNTTS